ncbi:uncharacterized protein si:dkey-163f14.6 isoform X2 [Dicentrarchus labrax]|uniref:uncharacterized protein si:dkey-163f14.6 isoform X2 n=1 Tax=Dicentrarchus labrax TaxID=13489 RepID=UPI0021F685F9|nr:uncharacterized protein si:dkey-163f14.6 isoform X2 [Dicentrarchus labrax]
MGHLAALVILLCIYTQVCGAEGCSGFRHLENGQTFFRYGGLLVIFRCHRGYKLHGYKTNSCVSGHWSRDTPVCVGSGCSNPGLLTHGTSSINKDGSWAVFSCNSGFKLHGPSMLYCKGHGWNSTKPVCKEADMMMSLVSRVNVPKPSIRQNLQSAMVLKSQQQSHYDILANTASKAENLKFGLLSHTPSQMSSSERIKVTNPKVHLQHQSSSFKVKDGGQTTHHEAQPQEANEAEGSEIGTGRDGSEVKASREDLSTPVSSTLSLVSGTEQSTSSPPPFATANTTASSAVKNTAVKFTVMFAPTSPLHTKSPLPVFDSEKALTFGEPVTPQDDATPSEVVTSSSETKDEDRQAETGFQHSSLAQPGSVDEEEPTETSTHTASSALSLSTSFPSISASISSSSSSTQSKMKTQLFNVTLLSNTSTTTEPRSHWTEYPNLTMNATSKPPLLSLSLIRRPVCPYPPVPTHGTFYFRNVENPGPREYKHFIQYACYPGYTLAHGDVYSYCQQGGTWSGITPVCLELTPCSVNNGGCSQLCSHSQHYNQSSNQTQSRTQCNCRPGFTLLDDGRTCRDVDECLLPAAVTRCLFGCVNTPGSFHCQCPPGYSLPSADSHCQDIDECAVNQGLGPCMQQCNNSPGSYRCSCTYGHILAGNGHSCITECPPGYMKQSTTPENSTAQALKEECVDINECQEEMCAWQCINLPGSHRCICPRGYTLERDGRRCKDINECSRKNGGCSHLCVNQKGGHKCACPPSHRLSPYSWKKCLPRTTANTAG